MTEIENANSGYDHRLSSVEQACVKMRAKNEALCSKVTDLEAHSRCQNIKIAGLPEKIKNRWSLTDFLPEMLGTSNFPRPTAVD